MSVTLFFVQNETGQFSLSLLINDHTDNGNGSIYHGGGCHLNAHCQDVEMTGVMTKPIESLQEFQNAKYPSLPRGEFSR